MTPFERQITAAEADVDELGHVNNAVWVRWIQDVATAHWNTVARPEHRDAYIWVVVRHEIDYLRAVGPGETVTARTWVGEAPKGARFDRTWSSSEATVSCGCGRRPPGPSSRRKAAARSAFRPRWWRLFFPSHSSCRT